MIKTTNWMLTALLTIGLSMGFVACSDDDDDDNNGGAPTNEAEYEEAGLGWDIITQLTAERTAPEGWQSMTFEPTIGKASETDPYTRVVATNDVAAAAERFSGLVGLPDLISETTTSFTYNQEGMGKLTYQMGSVGGQYLAQVDVDLKQVPHLKKILYQTPEQMGNNSSFAGTAWYRFGDVVKDKDGYYWICVRPAFGPEGKEDSHWMCLSQNLPDANIKPYKTSTDRQNYLPTGLGKSTEHMQNTAEMFYAMLHPNEWFETVMGGTGTSKPKMFNDFNTNKIQYHNTNFWQLVCTAWENQGLFEQVLGVTKETLDSNKEWHMLYSGYSWWFTTSWNCSLYEATFKNGKDKKANMHDATYASPTKDMHDITLDAKSGNKVGTVNGDFFDDDHKVRWYARYKKGSELSTSNYNVKTALSGCEEIYTYNRHYYPNKQDHDNVINGDPEITTQTMLEEDETIYTGAPYYLLGDVLVDEEGARWFCVQHSGIPTPFHDDYVEKGKDYVLQESGYRTIASPYAWFISLTPYDKNGYTLFQGISAYYSNLPTLDQARYISQFLSAFMISGPWSLGGASGRELATSYNNIKEHAKVDLAKAVARRDSVYDAGKNEINHIENVFVNVAYSDNAHAQKNEQGYLRNILNGCVNDVNKTTGEIIPGSRLAQIQQQTCYTVGNYSRQMFLSDLTDANVVRDYAYDEWVIQPWYTEGNEGDKPPYSQIYPRQKIRNDWYASASPDLFLWDDVKLNFFNSNMTSMYKEPIIMCRVMKVTDRGQKATRTSLGKSIVEEHLCPFELGREGGIGSNLAMALYYTMIPYIYNGTKTTVLDIPFIGEEK